MTDQNNKRKAGEKVLGEEKEEVKRKCVNSQTRLVCYLHCCFKN